MAIVSVWNWDTGNYYCGPGGGGESNTAPWTVDLAIGRWTIFATSSLTSFAANSYAGASAGFLSYWTQDPNTLISSSHVISPNPSDYPPGVGPGGGGQNGLTNTFFDYNVIIVTIAWNLFADDYAIMRATFSLFGFD